jgi:hypothetical protein
VPLFGASKRTVAASEYARWFHTMDSATDPVLASLGPAAFAGALRDEVAKIDPRFGATDLDVLTREVSTLRAEIFGLAWSHAFKGKESHLIAEGAIAREVLGGQGLWDIGDKYNQAVATSVEAELPSGGRSRRMSATFENSIRVGHFVNLSRRGVPAEVVARIVSRFFSEDPWKKGQTLRYLLLALLKELGHLDQEQNELALNQEALIAIQVALNDIYVGSRENFARYNIKAD